MSMQNEGKTVIVVSIEPGVTPRVARRHEALLRLLYRQARLYRDMRKYERQQLLLKQKAETRRRALILQTAYFKDLLRNRELLQESWATFFETQASARMSLRAEQLCRTKEHADGINQCILDAEKEGVRLQLK